MKTSTTTKMRLLSFVLTLTMLIGMIPMAVMAEEYPTISLGQEVSVTLNGTDATEAIYKFVPETDGTYIFYSYSSDHDTYGHILDSNMEELTTDDDDGEYNNFRAEYDMTAGTTYYLKGRFFSQENDGSFKMMIVEGIPATSLTITSGTDITMNEGCSENIYYEFSPVICIYEDVSISSSDTSVVSADEDQIYAHKAGTATVTVTSENGLTDYATVTVIKTDEIKLDTECTVQYKGGNVYYQFTPDEDGTYGFYSYNNNGINIDLTLMNFAETSLYIYGENTANGNERIQYDMTAGKTYLLSVSADQYCTFNVKLQKLVPATGIRFEEDTYSGTVGTTSSYPGVLFEPENALWEEYTLTSKDEDIVAVNDDGTLSLLTIGSTTVTVTSDSGFTDSCTVNVTDYEDLFFEKPVALEITDFVKENLYRFTPEENGDYAFYSIGDLDTHGYIYDEDMNVLVEDDDEGEDNNFLTSYYMTAGTTYILRAGLLDMDSKSVGTVGVQVSLIDENGNILHDIEEYTYTDTGHSGYCKTCGTNVTQSHNIYDGSCICGYTDYTECKHMFKWYDSMNEEMHAMTCVICLGFFGEEHNFGDDGICPDCGYEIHEHVIEKVTYMGSDYHEGICNICSYTSDYHEFDDNGVCFCGYIDHEHSSEYLHCTPYDHVINCTVCELKIWEEHAYNDDGVCKCGYVDGQSVIIGGTILNDGDYLDEDGNVTDTEPDEWSAYYADGVLTLNDLTVTTTDWSKYAIFAGADLEIVVNGKADLTTTKTDVIYISGGNLTISGEGTLNITSEGNYDGIDVDDDGDVTVDGPTVIIEAKGQGIEVSGKFTMESGTVIIDAGDDGIDSWDSEINGGVMYIYTENIGIDADKNTTVNGGYINIRSGEGAISAYSDIIVDPAFGEYEKIDENGRYYLGKDGEMIYSVNLTAEEKDSAYIESDWITLSADSSEYTGEDLLPEVTVENADGKTLEEGVDYTLTWSADEAIDTGVYYAVIEGIGDYHGTQYVIFTVIKTTVYVGGVMMENGDYLANGSTETTKVKPASGYAYYADGVLELNNYEYEGTGYEYDSEFGYAADIYSENELIVKLAGASSLTNTVKYGEGITLYGDLTVMGSGSLTVNSDYGIYSYIGNVIFDGGIIVINNSNIGMYTDDDVTINGGYVNISAVRYAVRSKGLTLSDDMTIALPESAEIKYILDGYYIFGDGMLATDVIIAEEQYGDANCDGNVNISDISLMLKHIAKWDVLLNEVAADANVDGNINLSDVSLLLKYIAKWDVTLGK